MALPSTFPKISTVAPATDGIVLWIVPGDPAFEMELQRTTDSGGVPNVGAAVTIAQLSPAPRSGRNYRDWLAITGTKYYYRYRHTRLNWTAGDFSAWTRAAVATFPYTDIPIDPSTDTGSVSDETIGADGIIVLGPDGRDDLTFNGDAEQGLSYWQGVNRSSPLTIPIPVYAAVNFGLNTATPFAGQASFQFDAVAVGCMHQTVRPTNVVAESTRPLLFRILTGDLFRVQVALKASSASTSVFFALRVFNDPNTEVGAQVFPGFTVGTSWANFELTQTTSLISANWKYAAIYLFCGETDGRTVHVDKLKVTRLKTAADLGGTIAPPTVDGWYQDDVAASQTNVELVRAVGRWRATSAGSVTGVVATMTEARTAGTLTVKVFKNTGLAGAAGSQLGTLTAVIDGTNTSRKASTQAKDLATFAAGDELYLTVTTDAGWLPVTSDLRAALEMEI